MSKRNAVVIFLLSIAFTGFTWLHAQQNTVRALTANDYTAIQQLYARYNFAIDGGDAEGYAALFVPDGSFNNNAGHDALVAFIRNRNSPNLRHWNTNLMITGTPEGANGAVYLMLVDVGAKPTVITTAAKYEDTLVRTPQGWRFKTRRTHPEATAPAKQ